MIRLGELDPVNEVSGIQQRLSHLGYAPGEIDGLMGPKTRGAVILFQEDQRDGDPMLEVDGIPGPKTQRALEMPYRSHSE
ncbi:MAG: peptidoglycan-binding domain-containing protein [Candidatus Thiodiazotropha sp.]